MLKKLYHLRSHFVVTSLDAKTGICKIGLSDYALKYFLRFNKIDNSDYAKTVYGMAYTTPIGLFIKETFQKYQQQMLLREKIKLEGGEVNHLKIDDGLNFSQKMQYDRFLIKRGQPFSMLKTCEYDIELTAPFDMRVIDLNHDIYYFSKFLTVPYFFQVQCLNTAQLSELISQEQYAKTPKFFEYC